MNRLIIHADLGKHVISRHIYGHFAEHLGRCIYDGFWVGQDSPVPNVRGIRTDIVEALRGINIPVLRWPGGCFADSYDWRDGIGPRQARPRTINTHWGGVIEDNHFGTHEFMDLCDQLQCDAYICGNVGSGTVREMRDWVEYLTSDGNSILAQLRRKNGRDKPWNVPFWGVGNENWGCGGCMTPEYYADLYKRYALFVQNVAGDRVYKIACGPHGDYYRWTEVLMREAAKLADGLALHYYTGIGPASGSRSATAFGEEEWFVVLKNALAIDELITRHSTIMDRYDPEKRVGLVVDEWGTWYEVEPGTNPGFLYQQNTLRDALVAGVTLNAFNRNCDRVRMANIAQTVNVLQAMILTDRERMILTPTYHVFEMYKVHQDAVMLPLDITGDDYAFGSAAVPTLNASASRDDRGMIHISVCNLDPNRAADTVCELRGMRAAGVSARILTAKTMSAYNTFEEPDRVRPATFDDATLEGKRVCLAVPAKSVLVLEVQPDTAQHDRGSGLSRQGT